MRTLKSGLLWTIGVTVLGVVASTSACSGDTEPPTPLPATGGSGGDGGAGKGGSGGLGGKGGTGGTGGDAGTCPTITFVTPENGASLAAADDKDKNCSNGFQYDVELGTSAANGAEAKLYGNNVLLKTAPVWDGAVKFEGVVLDSNGPTTLKAQIGAATCTASNSITVQCDAGACTISIKKPTITPTHPALNGVPAAQGGDMASAPGNPYQVGFEIQTNAGSGTTATLTVDGKASAASAQVDSTGKAVFPGVTLVPDGDHKVMAVCKKQSGPTGTSAEALYPVDTKAPDLAVSGVTNGQAISFGDDVDPNTDGVQFDVCGDTTSTDATDLPASLGAGQNNYCVKVGGAQATCVPAVANKGCVRLDCSSIGSAAQDVSVTLKDWAGNPTVFTATAVKCDTEVPTITIVDPVAYDPNASTPFILNVSKDKDAAFGLQYDVVVCTTAAVGSQASLMQKATGAGTFAQVGAPVAVAAAQAMDNCPANLPNVARFVGATLAESEENADGTLLNPTQLRVDLTVSSKTFSSAVTDEWVDSTRPGPYVVNLYDPTAGNALVGCNSLIQSLVEVTTAVRGGCDGAIPIAARVEHADLSVDTTGFVVANGIVNIPGAIFKTGPNSLRIIGTEPSGNDGESAVCPITVGKPPVLTFVTPTGSTVFNLGSTDTHPATPGFQTNVQLTTNDDLDPVSLVVQGQAVGTANPSGGSVTFQNVTLPEGDAVQIQATQTSSGGTASPAVTVRVDVHAPSAGASPQSSVTDRRAATATVSFAAPSDHDPVTLGTRPASSYELRYITATAGADCNAVLTDATFATATLVVAPGLPGAPGAIDTRQIPNLTTGRSYCVGFKAKDAAQNVGPLTVFPIIEPGWLNQVIAPPTGASNFGGALLSDIDLDQDGYYDLLIGGDPNSVWIYYGSAAGLESAPSVRIVGPTGALFGLGIFDVGNFDASTEAPKPLPEFAVGAQILNSQGGLYVFSLPASLHAQPMTTIQITPTGAPQGGTIGAHFVIMPDGSPEFNTSYFGGKAVGVGDFDGDGIHDLVVGAYGGASPRAFLIRGRTGAPQTTLVMPVQSEVEFTTTAPSVSAFGLSMAPLGKSGIPGVNAGVVLGAATANGNEGALYAIAGQSMAYGAHLVLDVASAAIASSGGAANEYFGGIVGLVGDIDGDGFDDFLAGNFDPTNGYVVPYKVYGGSPWGQRGKLLNDLGAINDQIPRRIASPSLFHAGGNQLNAEPKGDMALNTYRSSGVPASTLWVVPGAPKNTGAIGLSAAGVRPTLPAGTNLGFDLGFGIGAAGNDTWPDIFLGDRNAAGGGRVIVVY